MRYILTGILYLILTSNSIIAEEHKPVEVTVTGVGATIGNAEKSALMDAVQQAVGMILDQETLIKDEKVIYEKILTHSDGFVKSYDKIKPARKRPDGLYEVKLLAVVEKGKVRESLKSTKILKNIVSGKDIWAEEISKLKSFNDGHALLEKYLKNAAKKLCVVRLIGEKGKIGLDVKPKTKNLRDKLGTVEMTLHIQEYFDQKAYFENFLPTFVKILDNISKYKGKTYITINGEKPSQVSGEYSMSGYPQWHTEHFIKARHDEFFGLILCVGRSKFGKDQTYQLYILDKGYLPLFKKENLLNLQSPITVSFRDKSDNIVAQHQVTSRYSHSTGLCLTSGFGVKLAPIFNINYHDFYCDVRERVQTIKISDSDLKKVSSIVLYHKY